MKNVIQVLLVFFGFLSLAGNSSAQNFSVTPGNNITQDIKCNDFWEYKVDFPNLTSSQLVLQTKVLENTLPPCWQQTICILGPCFSNIPDSTQMDTVQVGGKGYLKLNILLTDSGGSGTIRFHVFEPAFPSSGDTITFTVSANNCSAFCQGWISGIKQQDAENKKLFSVTPNIVSDFLFIDFNESEAGNDNGELEILNSAGKIIRSEHINTTSFSVSVNMSGYASGVYFVRYRTSVYSEAKIFIRK